VFTGPKSSAEPSAPGSICYGTPLYQALRSPRNPLLGAYGGMETFLLPLFHPSGHTRFKISLILRLHSCSHNNYPYLTSRNRQIYRLRDWLKLFRNPRKEVEEVAIDLVEALGNVKIAISRASLKFHTTLP